MNRVLASSEFVEKMRLQGYEPVGGTPDQAGEWIRTETARWTKVIREAGIRPQQRTWIRISGATRSRTDRPDCRALRAAARDTCQSLARMTFFTIG